MISHFATTLGGGANLAGYRLHNALRRAGHDSRFYCGSGSGSDPSVLPLFENNSFLRRNLAALATSWRSRQLRPTGFVTGPRWIRKTPIWAIGTLPRVVNLHWVARWLDLPSFFESLPEEMPIVWTLHDLIPITGGCHYPYECQGFTQECGNCPQLKHPHPNDATRRFFHVKEKLYRRLNLHFVGNSAWTTEQANRSALVKAARSVRTIHYGLDLEAYKPVDRSVAKRALGLSEDKFIVGFACADFHELRKGGGALLEALKILPAEKVALVVMGGGKWPRDASDIETVVLGSINSTRIQSIFYSALDVFAMPSLIETFGNVAMEAMACNTPVIGYAAGGLADVVTDGETGLMEREIGNVPGLAQRLRWMQEHPKERMAMGLAGRQRVASQFSDTLMAERYNALYHELLPGQAGL